MMPDFSPADADILELHAALESGRISCEQLVRYHLERIARFDQRGPQINALISLNPRALEQAASLDARRAAKRQLGVLHGIPFIAKDNFNTTGIPTSGGSAALASSVPCSNAFVVQKLLDQGAILIGKANMSELAQSFGRLGYSSAGGLTLNPYDTSRNVSGSSSGSAAAVAAGFASFALGTDTSGSLRAPASVAGLVGLRPTVGLTSRAGVIPLSPTFDTVGVLTRSVRDTAVVLDAIAGSDPADTATLTQPAIRPGYATALKSTSLRGVRLGVVDNFRGCNAGVDGIERDVLCRLESRGAVLIPVTWPKEFESLWTRVLEPVCASEFKPQFERYLKALPAPSIATLSQWLVVSTSPGVEESSSPVNPALLDALRAADAMQRDDEAAPNRILTEVIPAIRRRLRTLTEAHDLEAFVFSTSSCPASPRFDRADPTDACTSGDPTLAGYVASAAGFPEVTVPAGRIGNLPVGYSFMGLPYSEARLLQLADAFASVSGRFPAAQLR